MHFEFPVASSGVQRYAMTSNDVDNIVWGNGVITNQTEFPGPGFDLLAKHLAV
jgi:hypothetical protein